MASSSSSRYEVEVKVESARGLKNVNWRHGKNRPYGVVWVDPKYKFTTKVDENGDVEAEWENETLVIPLPPEQPLEDLTLNIDVVHAKEEHEEDTKPLIGSARLKLAEVLDERSASRTLTLKRPSGRPQGKVDINVTIREPGYRAPQGGYNASTYSVPPPPAASSRDYYSSAPRYGYTYGTPQDYGYYSAATTPAGYPCNATPQTASYGQGNYPSQTVSYGQGSNYGYGQQPVGEEKKSKFGGMGTGLAVGAVAGVLGGIALAEGAEYVEDKIAEDAAEKVEDDLGYDDDDGDGGDDGDYGGDDF